MSSSRIEESRLYSQEVTVTVYVVAEPGHVLDLELDSGTVRQRSECPDGVAGEVKLGVSNLTANHAATSVEHVPTGTSPPL